MAMLVLLVAAVFCLVPLAVLFNRECPRALDYFLGSEPSSPSIVRNATIAYALPLIAVAAQYDAGVQGRLVLVIATAIALFIGYVVLDLVQQRTLPALDRLLARTEVVTGPAMLGAAAGRRARTIAALLTILLTTAIVAANALVFGRTLAMTPGVGALLTAAGLIVIAILQATIAGQTGAMGAAQAQLGVGYFGLFGALLPIVYLVMSNGPGPAQVSLGLILIAVMSLVLVGLRRTRYADTASLGTAWHATPLPEPALHGAFRRVLKIVNVLISVFAITVVVFSAMFLYVEGPWQIQLRIGSALSAGLVADRRAMVLIVVALLWPAMDTSNWQRIAALRRSNVPAVHVGRGLRRGALEAAMIWIVFGAVGAVAPTALGFGGAQDLPSFISGLQAQQDPFAFVAATLLLLALGSFALACMAQAFLAAQCTLACDLLSPPGEAEVGGHSRRRAAAAIAAVSCFLWLGFAAITR